MRPADIGCSIRYVRGFVTIRELRGGTGKTFLMFASDSAISGNERLRAEASREPQPELEWVHISMVRKDRSRNALLSAVSHALPVRLKRRLKGPVKAVLAMAHVR